MPKKKIYRQMVEDYLGHPIPKGFSVHHISGDHNDNRLENLFICRQPVHLKLHQTGSGYLLNSNLDVIKEQLDKGINLDVKRRKRKRKKKPV